MYGGRVFSAEGGNGCLICHDLLDLVEARNDLESVKAREDRTNLYGMSKDHLAGAGPSVVSINGVIASLAVTEFAVAASGLRRPHTLLTYRADLGRVTLNADRPLNNCYYCKGIYGTGEQADIDRYLSADEEEGTT